MDHVEHLKYQHQCIAEATQAKVPFVETTHLACIASWIKAAESIPSWAVIVDGAVVWTGGYGRAKREADRRGGILRPSDTCIMVSV